MSRVTDFILARVDEEGPQAPAMAEAIREVVTRYQQVRRSMADAPLTGSSLTMVDVLWVVILGIAEAWGTHPDYNPLWALPAGAELPVDDVTPV